MIRSCPRPCRDVHFQGHLVHRLLQLPPSRMAQTDAKTSVPVWPLRLHGHGLHNGYTEPFCSFFDAIWRCTSSRSSSWT